MNKVLKILIKTTKDEKMQLDRIIGNMTTKFPKTILLVFISISILSGLYLKDLTKDPTPYLLPPTHESRINLEKLKKEFTGSRETILILLQANHSIFNYKTLSRIKNLTTAFENIDIVTKNDIDNIAELSRNIKGELKEKINTLIKTKINSETWMLIGDISMGLESSPKTNAALIQAINTLSMKLSPIVKVTSLANSDNILGKNGELDVSPIYEQVPRSRQDLELIKDKVCSNDLFRNILITDDNRHTSIIIELAVDDDQSNEKYMIYQKVKDILKNQIPGPEKCYIAGMPVASGALGKVMEQDIQKLFPIVLLIVVICLFLTFRKIKGILIPLSVVLLSLIVTLGIEAMLKIPLNILTTTLPVFILSIGVADGIHIFSEYNDTINNGYNKIEAVKSTLHHLTMPVIMTSLTTAVAFYTISMTEIVQLKYFGIFVGVGTLVAMFFSLFFIPALLVVIPEKNRTRDGKKNPSFSKFEQKYTEILISATNQIIKKPILTSTIAGILFITAIFGATQVVVDNNIAKYFLKNSPIYISTQKLNKASAGSVVINFIVTDHSKNNQPFKDPQNLKIINNMVNFLKSKKITGKVLGLTELIKRINYVIHDEAKGFNIVPGIANSKASDLSYKNIISQLLLLYENGGGDILSDLSDSQYKKLNIKAILKTNSSHQILQFTNQVKAFVKSNFPDNLSLEISGSANVAVAATHEIVKGQIISMIASLGVVFLMLLITFRTIKYALVAIIPLSMTIAINFGVMGFFKIPLDIGTAIISSIVIGIGVDYGIHYISRFKKNRKSGMDFNEALENTIAHSGKAIVSNAITVGLGFIALLFSILTPLILMGWMITLTMILSAGATLILIPVFIYFLKNPANQKIKTPRKQRTFGIQKKIITNNS